MEIRDYNLIPREHVAGAVRWVYLLMDAVLVGIKAGARWHRIGQML